MSDEQDDIDPTWHAKGTAEDNEALFQKYSPHLNVNTPDDPVTVEEVVFWRKLTRYESHPLPYLLALGPNEDSSTGGILNRVEYPPRPVEPPEEPE